MRRLSGRVPALLLGLATVFGAVGVAEAWRAARSNRATAEALLRDYGEFAAWTFSERAQPLLDEAISMNLAPFWRRYRGRQQSFRTVAEFRRHGTVDQCGCGNVFNAAFHFRLPLDATRAEFAGSAPAPGEAASIAEAVLADAPRLATDSVRPRIAVLSAGSGLVAYTLDQGSDGVTTAWGFSLDAEAVSRRVSGILTACSLLPPSLIEGRPNDEVVAIALMAPGERTLFATGHIDPVLAAEHALSERLGGMVVRASILPGVADDLIIGGLPRSRVPLMLGVFALAAVLAGVAVAQLRRAQELARLRSDFVAGVSHELRTPLAQIRIYADTLALGRAETEDRRAWSLDGLRRETTRLEHLVDNILQFARASRPHAATCESTEICAEAQRAVDAFRPLALRRARLEFTGSEVLCVSVSAESLRQIIGNLLDNAVKYGPRGQIVRVHVERAAQHARIVVEDEGPGVPVAERDAVWEMYRRGERESRSEVGGSGIGLAVVRRIAASHGGRTRIEDGARGGARVVVELPLQSLPLNGTAHARTLELTGVGAD